MSLTTDPKTLEKEQEYDLKSAKLADAWKKDNDTISECINRLVEVREGRATQFEMDLLNLKGEYGQD
jgi:hypothetical protein